MEHPPARNPSRDGQSRSGDAALACQAWRDLSAFAALYDRYSVEGK